MKTILVPIHSAGWPFIAIFAGIAIALAFVWQPLGWLGAVLTLWCIYFFRNPDRVTPTRAGLVIAPADGVVQLVDRAPPPEELEMGNSPMTRIGIFMNVFNVHVNRAPVTGTVKKAVYKPGKFFNASLDKASEFNERQALCLVTEDGVDFACVQIAGLVARRIRCDVSEGSQLSAGERFGLIRFGSRVDVYMPDGIAPLAVQGQQTVAGETVIGDLEAQEPKRSGEVR